MRSDLPTGTVTFLFTDVEGSTRLLDDLGSEEYAVALAEHRRLIREACAAKGGVEVDTQGDAFFFAFPTAPGAVAAARGALATLEQTPITVRAGLHTGTPLVGDEGYVGHDVHRAARIAAAGHGGQILVSAATATLVSGDGLLDLGEHRFKDLAAAERVYQLGDGEFPPLRSLYRTNLPVTATPFLGRERELAEVVALLAREDVRAVTLTGPGGTGKTRLALQAAAEWSDRYPDGTWWVPLASLRDASLVPGLIAQAVGASVGLAEHIAGKRMLLLLDNLEHLLGAVGELAVLLRACPKLEILTTSREVLQLQAEHAYAVPTLTDDDATGLFLTRATAAAGEQPSGEVVGGICRRLDNLPLAIELAAARMRHLTAEQLLERLTERLDLLQGARDADPRQQTLRATIEWSYDLLDDDERRLFARLSTFAGGCTLDAVEKVCDSGIDVLSSLMDKSLVRRTGERYWMLEVIRDFAGERLRDSGEEEAAKRRHAEYLAELLPSLGFMVEAIEAGAAQRHDIAVAELGNVRAAIEWARDGDPVLALRIASSLENFWVSYDPFEARRLFEELAALAADAPDDLRVLATRSRGNLHVMTGDDEAGLALYEACLELYRDLGDEHGAAITKHRIGANLYRGGQRERARAVIEDSLRQSTAGGFRVNEMMALGTRAWFDFQEGDVEQAFETTKKTLESAQEVGFRWWESNLRGTLVAFALELGRIDEAEEHARAELRLGFAMSDRRHALQGLGYLAQIATLRGDTARAGRLWGALETEELRGGAVGQRPRMRGWDEDRAEFEALVFAEPDDVLERGRVRGRRMTLEDAVAYATSDA